MKRLLKFLVPGLLLAAAVVLLLRLRAPAPGAKPGSVTPVAATPAAAPLQVSALRVQALPYAESLTATGTLRAEESVDLQAEVSGKIVAINFEEGRRVRKGDLLMKLNDAELGATRARAAARLRLAQLREKRFSDLAAVGGINAQDYDTVESELAVQTAEVELIEAQIAKTELRAPFDGTIGLRFVSEGAFITATSTNAARIATLQRLDNLKIDFAVPEKYASRIRVGTPVLFTVAGYGERFRGEVYAFEPRIDVSTRTLLIRALCPNAGGALLPGAFATVEMHLDQLADTIFVPANVVIPGLSEKNVFVVQDGKAVRRAVQTGTRTESAVRIVGGLQPGDVLITSGLQQLRQGQPVRAIVADPRPIDPTPAPAVATHGAIGAASP